MAYGLDLGNLVVHLRANETQLLQVMSTVESRLKRTADKMTKIGRQMTARVTAPIVALGTLSTKSFSSFDDAMTKSVAIMGDITEEMKQELRDVAIAMSKEGVTSATKLAKSYFYLASAGLTAEQSLQALQAVNDFAIAGTFDLSQAVEMAAGSQRALGMASKDPVRNLKSLTRVTDVLVGANLLAQATTSQFAEALASESAAAMKVWGIELEEGVAMLAAYAAQMKKGAAAGSAFGRMLRLTMQGYRKNTEEWKKMGLTIFDVSGNLRPLADVIEDLTNKLGPMSAEAKGAALQLLGFQARSQQVILPLLGMSDAIRGFHSRLKEMSGFSKSTAEKNMQSFAAQMRITWNYVTAVSKEIGAILAPAILKIGKHVREVSSFWSSLNETVKKNIIIFAGVTAAIGPVLLSMGLLLKTFGFTIGVIRTLITSFTVLGGVIAAPLTAVLALAAVAYVLRAAWLQNISAIKDRMEEWFNSFKDGFDWLIEGPIGETVKFFAKSWIDAFAFVKSNFGQFLSDIAGAWGGLRAWIKGEDWAQAFVNQKDKADAALKDFNKSVTEAYKTTAITLSAFGEASVEQLEDLMQAVKIQFGEDADSIISLIKEKIQSLQKEVPQIETILPTIGTTKIEETAKKLEQLETSTQAVKSEGQRIIERMLRELDTELSLMGEINEERKRAIRLERFREVLLKEHAGDLETINEKMAEYSNKLEKLISGKRGFSALTLHLKQWASDATNVWDGIGEVAMRTIDGIAQNLTTMLMQGKVNFKAFARTVIAELTTIVIRARMAQAAMSMFPSLFAAGAGAAAGASTSPGQYGTGGPNAAYAEGGIAWQPQIATLAEKGPELITPLKDLKSVLSGSLEIHMHSEGTNQTITRAEEYLISDKRIIDVWYKDAIGGGKTARTVKKLR